MANFLFGKMNAKVCAVFEMAMIAKLVAEVPVCRFCKKRLAAYVDLYGRPTCRQCAAPKPVVANERPRRNGLCDCGSGKKSKKCCG